MTANYLLFLDDERTPPKRGSFGFGWEVEHARNIREFIEIVQRRGPPAMVCFDWYLGAGEPSGLDAARWLIDYDREHDVIDEDMLFDSQSSDRGKAREIVRLIADHIAIKFKRDDPDDIVRSRRRQHRAT